MNHTESRQKLRAILAAPKCVAPASIFDPLSARVAETVGFEVGLLSGSVVANTTLAAPDLLVHTATEFADQVRRITRASGISLLIDADHGYGNALNVMRSVQEFEHAGVSGLTIEDTSGPLAFGQDAKELRLIPIDEVVGKLRAALAARGDPSLVIVARTPALKLAGMEDLLTRVKAYAATGVDAIHLTGGIKKLEYIEAVHTATKLPIIIGTTHGSLTHEEMAACGARIAFQGHLPVAAVAKALREIYTHLFNGGTPGDLKSKIAAPQEMEQLINSASYKQWLHDYMR